MELKSTHSGVVRRLAPSLRYCPYEGRRDFGKGDEEMRQEVIRLGVDMWLYVAESMFLLCDDIRTMLIFCFMLWRYAIRNRKRDSPVVERLVRFIYYVYLKDIKPKKGVHHDHGNSLQWDLVRSICDNFSEGISDLDFLVKMLKGRGCCLEGIVKSNIGETLKKVEDKLKVAKSVSEANGFVREALKPTVSDLWKSVFDKEAKEATNTLKGINNGILHELFRPLWNEDIPLLLNEAI